MITITMYLRIIGVVPNIDQLEQLLSTAFSLGEHDFYYTLHRASNTRFLIGLGHWDEHPNNWMEDTQMVGAISLISYLSDFLRSLKHPQVLTECYIHAVREHAEGGLGLPPELFMALAAADLSLTISQYGI
jgi:hypothetical protein